MTMTYPPHLAFIPVDRRLALANNRTLPEQTEGAALLADVSGFTNLTQMLVSELGQKPGAEAVLTYINPVYEQLIAVLHQYRGSVIDFMGDAITCWFDETEGHLPSALRAVACGLAMQTALRPFTSQQTPKGTPFQLSVKVAIAAGPARRFLVGDPQIRIIDTVAGATLTRMAAAEAQAKTGELVVSRELIDQFQDSLQIGEWRGETAVITGLTATIPPTPWPNLHDNQLTLEQVRPWLLPTIYNRLQAGLIDGGDLRPVTPVMLRFSGLDFDRDPHAGQKLNSYVQWVQGILQQYGGTLLQLTLGDKGAYFYAPFGAPIAHEDDARRALTAALQLQTPPTAFDWLPPVQIGITQGAVWTGAYGAKTRCTYGAMGQDVNLAARLMMAAQPGQILVAGHAGQQADFQYQDVGAVQYKGFDQPIATYALLRAKAIPQPVFNQALVGRKLELEQLQQFARSIITQRQPGVAFIYGEAGMGKSHLAYALKQNLGDQVRWLWGQSDAIVQEAFHPFVYLLKHYFEQQSSASEQTNQANFLKRWEDLLLALDQMQDSEGLQAELQRTRSFLGALLNLYWPGSTYEQMDAEGRYQNTLLALSTLLQAECRRQPVVLELEDAHWFDEASQEMLTVLIRQLADLPCLILLTARYLDDGSRPTFALTPQTPVLTFDLQTLPPSALRQLAQAHLGLPVAEPLYNLLLEKSGANPFFAQQILHYLQERELIKTIVVNDEPTASLTASLPDLPLTLDALLVARLDRLTQRVKTLVQTAAVLGHEFDLRLLSQMLQRDVLQEVAAGRQQQIWDMLDELRHIFKHALLRDAAYEMQLVIRRQALHQVAAAALQTVYAADHSPYYGEIAYHYEAAYQMGAMEAREPAIRYLRLAGERAAERFENWTAVHHFSRALALTDDLAEQIELRLAREAIYHLLGEREAQRAEHEQLETLLADHPKPRLQATLALCRAHYATVTSDFETAVVFATRSVELAQAAGDTSLASEAQTAWGEALRRTGRFNEARARFQAAHQLAETALTSTNDTAYQEQFALLRLKLTALRGLGSVAAQQADYETARSYMKQSLSLAQAASDRRQEGAILNNLGNVYLVIGDLDTAVAYYQQALTLRRAIGDREGEAFSLGNLGRAVRAQGNLTGARHYYQENLAIVRSIGDRHSEANTLIGLGLLAKGDGDYDEARRQYEAALAVFQDTGAPLGIAIASHNLGSVAKTYGDYEYARRHQEQALFLFQEIGDRQGEWLTLSELGDIAFAQVNYARSRHCYEAALALQQGINGRKQAATLTRLAQALLEQKEWPAATAVLQEATSVTGDKPLPDTQVALAWLHLAQGDVQAVDPYLAFFWNKTAPVTDPRLCFTGYQLLQTIGDERATTLLIQAYQTLQALANQITQTRTRRSFLENVPWHRQIVAAWRSQAANQAH
jgi:adenylate cyclase